MTRLLFILLFLTCQFCFSQQKQAAIWLYGYRNLIDFNQTPVQVRRSTIGVDGVASISDSLGNILFHASGNRIFNADESIMIDIQQFNSTFQSGQWGGNIIVPYLNNSGYYHYFNFRNILGFSGPNIKYQIFQFVVDMNGNEGKGVFREDMINIFSDSVAVQVACMLHANSRNSWLVSRKSISDTLISWLISDTGVVRKVYSKTYSPTKVPNLTNLGIVYGYDAQFKSSPNSEFLFCPRRTLQFPYHELYRFNRETGQFYDKILIRDTTKTFNFYLNGFPDGAFSPDSKYLYVSTGSRTNPDLNAEGPGTFWQYSLENYDSLSIAQSKVYLGRLGRGKPNQAEPWPFLPRMQLGMDGKIYISHGSTFDSLMSVIHCPNKRGKDCQLKFRDINLHQGRNRSFFPTLNQTFVRNAGIFQLQANKRKLCKGDTLELSGYGAGAEKFRWSVSPALPVSVNVDTLTWQKIDTKNIPPGSYTFSCQAFSRCGDVFEKSMVVEVLPLPQKPNLVVQQKPVPCKGDSVNIRVQNVQTGNSYFWSTGNDSLAYISVKQTGLYSLDSISNAFGCGLKVGDTVAVSIKNAVIPPVPVILGLGLVEICEGQQAKLKVEMQNAKAVWSNGAVGDSVLVESGQFTVYSQTAEGCQSGSSDTVTVVSVPNPKPVFVNVDSVLSRETLQNQNYCVSGQSGSSFRFSVQGGILVDSSEDCVTVNWAVPPPSGAGGLVLSVTETLANPMCIGSVSQLFTYRPKLEIPSLITPNGDGKNDLFVIQDLEFYPNHSLQIFNRWGRKLLETNAYNNDWKGEEGIYFYTLSVDNRILRGWVTVSK